MACGVKERGALLRWRGITAVSRGGKRDREANVLDNNACFRYEKASAPTFPDMKKGARRAAEPAERGSKRSVRLHSSRAKLNGTTVSLQVTRARARNPSVAPPVERTW